MAKVDGYEVPEGLYFSKDFAWIKIESDRVRMGLTDYAQKSLREIVYAELPAAGSELKQGEPYGTVESVKAVSEIYAPVSGEVLEVNAALANAPEQINSDPHNAAWMLKLKLSNPAEVDALMDAAAYEAHIAAKQKETTA